MKRRIPIDAVGFVVIAIAMIVGHRSAMRHGLRFDDLLFHFGARVRAGDAPYRDFVAPAGPLPLYVDALAQRIVGSLYIASMYAALVVRILRGFVIFAIGRRLIDVPGAIALAVFAAFDPVLGPEYATAATYVELFALLAGLCVVRRAPLALAGLCAGLLAAASAGAAIVVAVFLALRVRVAAVWAGFAAGLALVCGVLAIAGVLGPALGELAQRTGDAHVLDALTGGASGAPIYILALPVAVVAAIMYVATRPGEVTLQTFGQIAIPLGLVFALSLRYGRLDLLTDVPRLFLVATVALAAIAPDRLRAWFGLEPALAAVFAALPLAADWGLGLTGAGDPAALVIGAILLALASSRLSARAKRRFCGALAAIAVAGLWFEPFAIDGPRAENTASSRVHWLRAMRMTEARKQTLDWLVASRVPHHTCFVDGDLPVLYTLLDCTNPTQIDSLALASDADLPDALAALHARPPDFVILHGPVRATAFDVAIAGLLVGYEPIGTSGDTIEPVDRPAADRSPDRIGALRLYARRQP